MAMLQVKIIIIFLKVCLLALIQEKYIKEEIKNQPRFSTFKKINLNLILACNSYK